MDGEVEICPAYKNNYYYNTRYTNDTVLTDLKRFNTAVLLRDLFSALYSIIPARYVFRACGVRVVILEHGALGICESSVCT